MFSRDWSSDVCSSDLRWDIGGVSTALHPDTGLLTVFVYDGHEGGAGFAERGYAAARDWLRATRDAIAACECATGCPSCIQSPKRSEERRGGEWSSEGW